MTISKRRSRAATGIPRDAPFQRLAAAQTIRHADVDGCRVILDLRSENYLVLDHVASAMWSILTEETDKEASLQSLAVSYGVDTQRLEGDLLGFARRCAEAGLLESPDAAPPVSGNGTKRARVSKFGGVRARSGALSALRCLIATQRAISREGFRSTYVRYGLISPSISKGDLSSALSAFRRAENFFILRRAPDDCLARSLALYRFLCEAGVRAEHLIGVKRIPFQAHAWVEHEGAPVLDKPAGSFTPIARLPQA